MIVIDIECSGINKSINGIWQIGAYELENPSNTFLMESSIDEDDEVHQSALKVIGKTESELRDKSKMSQKELIQKFFEWSAKVPSKNIIAQNPLFDVGFLEAKSTKYELHNIRAVGGPEAFPFPYRNFDLHVVAQTVYHRIKGEFLWKKETNASDMGLSNILEFCGIGDHRRKVHNGKIVQEGAAHNALEDAKLTGEAFSRLIYGKNLLEEFREFAVPEYLLKNSEEEQK